MVRITRESHPSLGHIRILKKGVRLYTGSPHTPDADKPLFLTPHKRLAAMYAQPAGAVYTCVTKRNITLVEKVDARWASSKGMVQQGEWGGFGSDESDTSVANKLCNRADKLDNQWASGIDGWVHKWSSPTLGEVMMCHPNAAVSRFTIYNA